MCIHVIQYLVCTAAHHDSKLIQDLYIYNLSPHAFKRIQLMDSEEQTNKPAENVTICDEFSKVN